MKYINTKGGPLIPMPIPEENDIGESVRDAMRVMIDHGIFIKKSKLLKHDMIDMSMLADGNDGGMTSSLPQMQTDEDYEAFQNGAWYYAVPPIKEGVLKINKGRYLLFKVSDIDTDNRSYQLNITDYALDMGVWICNFMIDSVISMEDTLTFNTKGATMSDLFEGFDDILSAEMDKAMHALLVKVTMPKLRATNEDDDYNDLVNHFVHAMIRLNNELSKGNKPKAKRAKNGERKTILTDVEAAKKPKPQVVRVLESGITIKSVKIPKAATLETIRHYKVASWNTRGHERHLRSGKVVYVRPSIHKRKCFEKTEAEDIKSSTKMFFKEPA